MSKKDRKPGEAVKKMDKTFREMHLDQLLSPEMSMIWPHEVALYSPSVWIASTSFCGHSRPFQATDKMTKTIKGIWQKDFSVYLISVDFFWWWQRFAFHTHLDHSANRPTCFTCPRYNHKLEYLVFHYSTDLSLKLISHNFYFQKTPFKNAKLPICFRELKFAFSKKSDLSYYMLNKPDFLGNFIFLFPMQIGNFAFWLPSSKVILQIVIIKHIFLKQP